MRDFSLFFKEERCDAGKVFQYNANACNVSCRFFSEMDVTCDVEDTPVDGCVCPEGQYSNSKGLCVGQDQCDCYMNDEILNAGQIVKLGNYTWYVYRHAPHI